MARVNKKFTNEIERYINSRYEEARDNNIRTNKEVEELKTILEKGISRYKCISIHEFIKKDIKELVLPNELLMANPQPIKPKIKRPNLITKVSKPYREKYNKYIEELKSQYSNEYKLYEEKENKILEEIINRKKEYDLYANSVIDNGMKLYKNAHPDFISSYKTHIFNNSYYPFHHNKKVDVQYFGESKELIINYLLPQMDIIPPIKEFEYVKTKDQIAIKERSLKDIKDMYKDVVTSITLRTIYEGFNSHVKEHIDFIVFNGYVENVSNTKDTNPYIISLRTSRQDFNEIDLSKVDKYKLLEDMNASLSI